MFDDIRELLFGCVYTIFTPFDVTGEIDYETLGKYIESIYESGAVSSTRWLITQDIHS